MKLSEHIKANYFHCKMEFKCFEFSLPQWIIKFLYVHCPNVFVFPSEIVNQYKDVDTIIEETEKKFF